MFNYFEGKNVSLFDNLDTRSDFTFCAVCSRLKLPMNGQRVARGSLMWGTQVYSALSGGSF